MDESVRRVRLVVPVVVRALVVVRFNYVIIIGFPGHAAVLWVKDVANGASPSVRILYRRAPFPRGSRAHEREDITISLCRSFHRTWPDCVSRDKTNGGGDEWEVDKTPTRPRHRRLHAMGLEERKTVGQLETERDVREMSRVTYTHNGWWVSWGVKRRQKRTPTSPNCCSLART